MIMVERFDHTGKTETAMYFGDPPNQANGVTLIEFLWIYIMGFVVGLGIGMMAGVFWL